MKKSMILVSWLIILVSGSWAWAENLRYSYHWEYDGEFRITKISSKACDFVFEQTQYLTKFFLVGPTHRTAVVHFRSDEDSGFIHGQSLIGLFGYMNDVRVEKKLAFGEYQVELVGEGLVNSELLFIQVGAKVLSERGTPPICTAVAEYTGFAN